MLSNAQTFAHIVVDYELTRRAYHYLCRHRLSMSQFRDDCQRRHEVAAGSRRRRHPESRWQSAMATVTVKFAAAHVVSLISCLPQQLHQESQDHFRSPRETVETDLHGVVVAAQACKAILMDGYQKAKRPVSPLLLKL